jgi:hypothetical protein
VCIRETWNGRPLQCRTVSSQLTNTWGKETNDGSDISCGSNCLQSWFFKLRHVQLQCHPLPTVASSGSSSCRGAPLLDLTLCYSFRNFEGKLRHATYRICNQWLREIVLRFTQKEDINVLCQGQKLLFTGSIQACTRVACSWSCSATTLHAMQSRYAGISNWVSTLTSNWLFYIGNNCH